MKFLRNIFRIRFWLAFLTIIALTGMVLSYLSVNIHPETIPWIPIFGLGYPIILLGTILLLVIWTVMKSKWSIAIIVILLIGWNYHFRTFSFGSPDKNKNASTELIVQSYNVHLFDAFNSNKTTRAENKEQMINYLENSNADVICLQEFFQNDYKTKNELEQFQKRIGTKFHYSRGTQTRRDQLFGVALFSKHKIIENGEVSFSQLNTTNNYCIYADIVKEKDTFRVYNIHLQSISLSNLDESNSIEEKIEATTKQILKAMPYRANQAQKVVNHIKNSPYPVIACGDFNDPPMSYTYSVFYDELEDAFRNSSKGIGRTYAGKLPAGRIDYIFHSETLGVKKFAIQEDDPSDHFGISCTLFKK